MKTSVNSKLFFPDIRSVFAYTVTYGANAWSGHAYVHVHGHVQHNNHVCMEAASYKLG